MRNMKKILALLLAVLMLVSLAGCGGNDDPAPGTTDPAASTKGTDPGKENDPAQSDPPKIDENLTIHENTFFTVGYNEEDGWMLEEDDIYVSDYGGDAALRIYDEDGYTDQLVEVEAYEDDAEDFRYSIHSAGIDLKTYADGTCESKVISGILMAIYDRGDGEWSCTAGMRPPACPTPFMFPMLRIPEFPPCWTILPLPLPERTTSILPGLGKALLSPAAQ